MLNSEELLMISPGIKVAHTERVVVSQVKTEDPKILNKLCILCIESMSTRVVRRNKSITAISNRLEELHANL